MGFGLKNTLSFLKNSKVSANNKSVGIDFGASAIKVVEIKKTENALALSTYGELQVGPYSEQPSGATVSLDHEKTIEALVDVIRESGVTADRAVFSVPLASSFLTTVSVEANDEEEIMNKIPVEARKHIPIPLKEVALDWFEIGHNEDPETKIITRDILMAAIQNESLSHFQRQQAAIGKTGQTIEIEAFSGIRSVAKDDSTPAVIIDLGASMSKLYIVKGATLQRIHRYKSGGEQITKHLAELKNLSFGEAEAIKCSFADDPTHAKDVRTAMIGTLDRAFQEFKRVIQQYQHQHDVTFSEIYIMGGGAQLAQVREYAADTFSLTPNIHNPFSKIAYPAFMEDTLKELGPSFAVALGAALRPHVEA